MPEYAKRPLQWLLNNISSQNIAADLPDELLNTIGPDVVYGYDVDVASRKDWKKKAEDGLDIAMQVMKIKTSPWPNCSNVKHPLIAIAAIQFAARAYPNIVKGTDVVKARVVGEDPQGLKEQRCKRVSGHMSWQLTEQMEEWEEDTDKLLTCLPIFGMYYRKTYYSPILGRSVSEGRSPLSVVVNNDARGLAVARRITDEVYLYKNDVIERENSDLFIGDTSQQFVGDPKEKPQELYLEQHCYWDLDNDGYEEPYIVTVHHPSQKVVRIVARYDADGIKVNVKGRIIRIEPLQHFTKYSFLPSPDGKFHDVGFSHLLGPLNETINTLINQLLDAGTLANRQGGFIGRGIRWKGGVLTFTPGEWKPVDVAGGVLKENIVPLPIKEPSGVLFQLLGALSETADRLASVSEAMTGEMPSQNTPATTVLAMIEQGLKVFTSIYKRVYRSLKAEYKKLYRLNALYLDETEYYRVLDSQFAVFAQDYRQDDLDIVPVADPNISSEAQRLARARAEMDTMQQNPTIGGRIQILRNYYEALETKNIEKVLPPAELEKIVNPPPPPPNPELLRLEADILKEKHTYELAIARLELDRFKAESDAELAKANAIKAVADAESKEVGQQFEEYKHQVDQLSKQVELAIANKEADTRARLAAAKSAESGNSAEPDAGSPGGMEAVRDDEGSVPMGQGMAGGTPGADGAGMLPPPELGGGDGAPGGDLIRGSAGIRQVAGDQGPGA